MIYYTPRFQLATLAAPQKRLISKVGGAAWGLPVRRWPKCCNKRLQKLVAQIAHQPPMIDLGDPSAVLHLFQCQECLGITSDKGRAAFIIDRAELGSGLSTPEGYDAPGDMGLPLIGESFINGWDKHDDGIPLSRLPEFYNEKKLWALQDEFPGINWFDSHGATKFGGSPRWTGNGPMVPKRLKSFQFLFQLHEYIYFSGKVPRPDRAGCQIFFRDAKGRDHTYRPGPGKEKTNAPFYISYVEGAKSWSSDYINLGTDGTLFVFVNRKAHPHRVKWFWNR